MRPIGATPLYYLAAQFKGEIDHIYLHWSAGWYGQFYDDYHINIDADGTIYMRLYLITREQFLEVQDQEGAWYSRRVDLGLAEDGNPICTFTAPYRYPSNPPSKLYRDWIESALICECSIPTSTAKSYLDCAVSH